MKVVIFHDYMDKKGGGERLVLNLAKKLNADIYTGFIDSKKTFPTEGINITSLGVNKRLPILYRNYLVSRKFLNHEFPKYDAYIFSGVWCISAVVKNKPNMLYLHTPPRFVYDLREYFMKKAGFFRRFFLKKFINFWLPLDQFYTRSFDKICPNSENVRQRVLKYYGKELYRKSRVVYTGIDTKKFYYKKHEDFYLSACRLDELKRVDMKIEAFKELNKELVIVGSGPEEEKLKKMAEGCKNIKFLGSVSEEKLLDLYSRCRAVVAADKDEDLGLTPIEANASGKPVIAVNEGGFTETVIDKKTGLFFEPDKESLKEAIGKNEKIKWRRNVMMKNAKKYDIDVFAKKITSLLKEITG